jgi:teichuronic acid exporter
MDLEIPVAVDPQEPPGTQTHSLGHTTARGFSWLLMNSITIKVVTLIQTILVGKLLTSHDYGVVSNVFSIGGLAAMIASVSVDDMLVQRQKDFGRWATSGFWVSLTLALSGAAVMLLATPFAEHKFHEPHLFGIVFVTALAVPLSNLQHVPSATLRSKLRYRTLAMIVWCQSMTQAILTVLMAWRGWGPYSILASRTMALGGQTVALWVIAHPRLRWSFDFPNWASFLGDGIWLVGVRIWNQLVLNGGYMVLGFLCGDVIAGVYFFASNLSATTTSLLVLNMGGVLMASLCKLEGEPRRQMNATLRASGVISLLGFPLSFLQAAATAPILHLLWQDKWDGSIPVLQYLSVGMVFQVLSIPGTNLLMAQARYRTLFFAYLSNMLLFFALVIPGAKL